MSLSQHCGRRWAELYLGAPADLLPQKCCTISWGQRLLPGLLTNCSASPAGYMCGRKCAIPEPQCQPGLECSGRSAKVVVGTGTRPQLRSGEVGICPRGPLWSSSPYPLHRTPCPRGWHLLGLLPKCLVTGPKRAPGLESATDQCWCRARDPPSCCPTCVHPPCRLLRSEARL